MAIPIEFKLFSSTIKVIFDNKLMTDKELYGQSDYSTRTITLCDTKDANKISKGRLLEIFYHEKTHMIFNFMEECEMSKDEKFVSILASLMCESDYSISKEILTYFPIPINFSLFSQIYEVIIDNERLNELHSYAKADYAQSKIFISTSDGLKILPTDLIVDMYYRKKLYLILLIMNESGLVRNEKFLTIFAKLWRQSNETAVMNNQKSTKIKN